jgi:WD40 repeat protein
MLASGNIDGTVEVWDLAHKVPVAEWQAHLQAVAGISFMPDGKRLATGSWDATGKLWDLETRRQTRTFTRTFNSFDSLAVAPDGQRITAGDGDGLIHLWSSTTGLELATLKTDDDVVGLQFLSTDENTIVSITAKEVRVWRAPSREEIAAAEARVKAGAELR